MVWDSSWSYCIKTISSLLLQIHRGSTMPRQVTKMNRSTTNWVQINNWIQQTAALRLHFTLYVRRCVPQSTCLHTRVSTRYQLVYIFWQKYLCTCLLSFLFVILGLSHNVCDGSWEEIPGKRTITAENEVEANKLVNNYRVRSLQAFLCSCDLHSAD